MWKRKKNGNLNISYDKTDKKPVIRASICTGEKVAGFRDEKTGLIEELMLITGEKDLQNFIASYGLKEDEIETVW